MSPSLISREAEVRAVLQVVDRARAGTAQVIGVEGPPGVGKSTLIDGVLRALPAGLVLHTRLDPTGATQRADALARLTAGTSWGPLPTGEEPANLARWIAEHIEDDGQFTSVIVDDAQWLDEESVAVLTHLLRQALDLPLLVILTSRSPLRAELDPFVRHAQAPGRGVWLHLQPFGRTGVRDLLESELGVVPDMAAVASVHDVTGGYPLYVSEVARQLADNVDPRVGLSEMLIRLKGSSQGRVLDRSVEEALQGASPELVSAHLAVSLADELTCEQLDQVLEVLGLRTPALKDILDRRLLVRTSRRSLRPRHAMLAQAISDRSAPQDLKDVHRALGSVLQGPRALEHRVRAAREDSEKAELVNLLFTSAIEHLLGGDGVTAFALAEMAAGLDPQFVMTAAIMAMRAQRPDLVARLDGTAVVSRGAGHAFRAAQAAAAEDIEGTFAALVGIDPAELDMDSLTLAAYAALEGCRLAMATGVHSSTESVGPLRDELTARRQAELGGGMPPEFLAEASNLIGLLQMWYSLGQLDARNGAPLFRDLRALSSELATWPHTERAVAAVESVSSEVTFFMGAHASTMDKLIELDDHAVTDPDIILQGSWVKAQILFNAGRWDEAQIVLRRALGRTLERHQDLGRLWVLATATAVPRCRGERDEADVHRIQIPSDRGARDLVMASLSQAIAWACFANAGDPEEIAEALDSAWETDRGAVLSGVAGGVLRVRAHLALGDPARARLAADQIQGRNFDRAVLTYLEAHCEALLSAITDPAASLESFAKAATAMVRHVEEQGDCALHLNRAVLAEDWARAVLAHGSPRPAQLGDELEAAVAVVAATGASAWTLRLSGLLEEVLESATPVGASHTMASPPARVPVSGPAAAASTVAPAAPVTTAPRPHLAVVPPLIDTLTTREREIAWLVADGMSNKEIASALFLSVRTVEFHISNVLRKLNCSSRVALRQVVRESMRLRREA